MLKKDKCPAWGQEYAPEVVAKITLKVSAKNPNHVRLNLSHA